jgi:hypothetical protein
MDIDLSWPSKKTQFMKYQDVKTPAAGGFYGRGRCHHGTCVSSRSIGDLSNKKKKKTCERRTFDIRRKNKSAVWRFVVATYHKGAVSQTLSDKTMAAWSGRADVFVH